MRRALVCAPLPPEFDRESGSRRIFDLIMLLREDGWAVSFYGQGGSPDHERYRRTLRQLGIPVYAGNYSTGAGDEFLWEPSHLVRNGQFDLIILAFWHLAEQLIPILRYHSPRTRIIVDTIDLHFVRNARRMLSSAPGQLSLLDGRYGHETAHELRAYAGADALLTVSAEEADMLSSLLRGAPPAYTVPDLEDIAAGTIPFLERRGMLFLGSFRHPPNREAARLLCQEILPHVEPALLADNPLYLVGNDLDSEIEHLGSTMPHVRMVGWAPSIAPYLCQCRITLLPLRHGAGTKRKLIQALMAGTPSVSTSIGIEGLGLKDGQHVLEANDPVSFAAAIEQLVTDESLWQQLANAGRQHIVTRHSRIAVRAAFLTAVERVMNAGASGQSLTQRMSTTDTAPNHPQTRPAFPDGHFYSPVIGVEEVIEQQDRIWPATPRLLDIDMNDVGQSEFITGVFRELVVDYDYPDEEQETAGPDGFFSNNAQFSGLDPRSLFVMLRHLRPQRMIEIGSGFSSLLTADVNRRFLEGAMSFTCIEPYPRPFLLSVVPGISHLIQQPVQVAPLDLYADLEENDILFVDSSHVSKTGSDVNHIIFEILPRLRRGVIIHFHDIFFPQDYPQWWVVSEQRSWNEAYLVRALLMGSEAFQVFFCSHYASLRFPDELREALQGHRHDGGSLWLRKLTDPMM